MTECFSCRQEPQDLPPREALLRTEHWRVAHAFDSSLPGPRRAGHPARGPHVHLVPRMPEQDRLAAEIVAALD